MDEKLTKLINPQFTFEFMGKSYEIRKATLDKAIQYQQKVKDLKEDPGADAKIMAYCIYIMLKDQIPELTEDQVLQNTPADLDGLELLCQLGFIHPSKLEVAKAIQAKILNQSTTQNSSQS